ncbi:hypothetical protein NC99_08940 [Sunxiuqinia dokdonensis]|uniref:Uncharacterized protein n=1 Tax=Sunxiuqinia dokdonensis TaxID=1409788 RepID=A0A0L8VCU7_9BACT|nr:hypothetical protein NC99_08940 [Sunxiuqinia dokdonensis]
MSFVLINPVFVNKSVIKPVFNHKQHATNTLILGFDEAFKSAI